MERFGWASRALSRRRRLTAWAGVVVVVMVAQLALVIAGSLAARGEANRALDSNFRFLANVSQERVLSYSRAAERSVGEVTRQVTQGDLDRDVLLRHLHSQLVNTRELGVVSVTYPNGDYVALSRASGPEFMFSSYVITHDSNGVVTRTLSNFDGAMKQRPAPGTPAVPDPEIVNRYRTAVDAFKPVWSEPALDPWTGSYEVWLSRPSVMVGGDVVVVSAAIELDRLSLLLNDLPAGSDGVVSVLSAERAVITARTMPNEDGSFGQQTSEEIFTTREALPSDRDVWGENGTFRTLERGLSRDGVDWVLHVRATTAGFNQGFAQVREIFRGVLIGTGFLTVTLGLILFRIWRPVRVLRDDVERDSLTGLRNRRALEEAVARTLRMAQRGRGSIAVVMLDIDHFKRLNDELGHAAGDRALRSLGRVLAGAVRPTDTAIRWGGDEFLLVLLLKRDDAEELVERLRTRLEQSLLRAVPEVEGLGVTAGYTLASQPGVQADVLVAEADRALVAGKLTKKGATYAAGSL